MEHSCISKVALKCRKEDDEFRKVAKESDIAEEEEVDPEAADGDEEVEKEAIPGTLSALLENLEKHAMGEEKEEDEAAEEEEDIPVGEVQIMGT